MTFALNRSMIPPSDREHIPEDLPEEALGFWWAAFRTGKEAAVPDPAPLTHTLASTPPIVPPLATADLGAAADGYQTPAEGRDVEPSWLIELIASARRQVADGQEDEAEAALRNDKDLKAYVETYYATGNSPSLRVLGQRAGKVLEQKRLIKGQENF